MDILMFQIDFFYYNITLTFGLQNVKITMPLSE